MICMGMTLAASSYSRAQGSSNLRLLKSLNPNQGAVPAVRYSEVYGCGDLALLAGWNSTSGGRKVYIYDVSDPSAAELLSSVESLGPIYDLQVHGRYLYLALQSSSSIEIYDLIDPRHPVLVNSHHPEGSEAVSPHTFFVAGNALYVADRSSHSLLVYDTSDKKNLVRKFSYTGTFGDPHDNTFIRGKLYSAFIFPPAGLWLANAQDPFAPQHLAQVQYPGAGTHHAWPTEDERYILTTDEIGSTTHNVKIWDTHPAGELNLVAEYSSGNLDAIAHNVFVRGRYAYLSYYCEGIRIIDIASPTHPVDSAYYDVNGSSPCSGYNSIWGIYPYSKYIYASDMSTGLHVFEFDDHPPANLRGTVTSASNGLPIPGAFVYFIDEFPTTMTNRSGEFEIPWFKDDQVRVAVEAAGFVADTATVAISSKGISELSFILHPAGPVDVEGNPPNAPSDYSLLPNYPNPFSLSGSSAAGVTRIAYHLPIPSQVRVEILNASGQHVATLFQGNQNAGRFVLEWNGKDRSGVNVSSGVYVVRMVAGGEVLQRKIMVVK